MGRMVLLLSRMLRLSRMGRRRIPLDLVSRVRMPTSIMFRMLFINRIRRLRLQVDTTRRRDLLRQAATQEDQAAQHHPHHQHTQVHTRTLGLKVQRLQQTPAHSLQVHHRVHPHVPHLQVTLVLQVAGMVLLVQGTGLLDLLERGTVVAVVVVVVVVVVVGCWVVWREGGSRVWRKLDCRLVRSC
ncbi:hypothetical protein BC629DRAFT_84939 [Irpex lacteus]|nr:hypothetical protein BC629DRAFT_84939 [Irpex lacteus]